MLNGRNGIDGESKLCAIVFDGEAGEIVRKTTQHNREMHGVVGMHGIKNVVVVLHTDTQCIERQ